MSILFKKYQNKNGKSKTYGKWYGRAVIINTISTEKLAQEVSAATTVTETDVRAVFTAMGAIIKNHLQNSEKVQFERLGSLSAGLKTTPAPTVDDFSANNVSGYRLNFAPEKHFILHGVNEKGNRVGVFVNDLLEGVTVKEAPKNIYGKDSKKKSTSDASTSGSDTTSGSDDVNSGK